MVELKVSSFEMKSFDDSIITLGDMMRGERATKGETLSDVSKGLCINIELLESIENGDLSRFSTLSSVSGYVRSYAKYLGMDPQDSFEKFCKESGFKGAQGNLSQGKIKTTNSKFGLNIVNNFAAKDSFYNCYPPNPSMSHSGIFTNLSVSGLFSSVFLCALISGLGYGGWKVLQQVQRIQFAPVNETLDISYSLPNIGKVLQNSDIDESPIESFSKDKVASLEQLYRPQELSVPELIARDGPIFDIDVSQLKKVVPLQNENIKVSANLPIPKVIEPSPLTVDIIVKNPAWIRVSYEDGGILFEKILDAGERYRVPLDVVNPMLRAGNSGSVYLIVAQKVYGPIGVKTRPVRKVLLVADKVIENFSEVRDANLIEKVLGTPLNLTETAILIGRDKD